MARSRSRRTQSREVLGVISFEGLVSEKMAMDALSLLRALPGEPPIQGLILRVSSGGGSLGAAQAIAEGIEFVAAELGIPTVASVVDLALSAGFYVALSADRIVATPGASLGGVGAVIRSFSFEHVLTRIGIHYEGLASGPIKDALFPGAPLTDEQRAALQSVVDDCSAQFLGYVARRRPACATGASALLGDGRIVTGNAALRAGLIDDSGGLFAAISTCGEMAGLAAPELRALGHEYNSTEKETSLSAIIAGLARVFPG